MHRGLPFALALAASACAATASLPRFPPDVAAAVVDHDMRRLETDSLIVYYPAARREQALRTTARITTCQQAAVRRTKLHGWPTRAKPVIVMPELPFNNAFVMPRVIGYEQIAVVPTENTLDFATAFGLPPDPAWVGCHEIVHYVQESQFGGFWGVVNRIFGNVLSPQNGLDPWFWEGLATYYEGESGAAGRLHWPVWRGMFEAAYAGGGLDGDDLSEHKRLAPPGHHYLVGSHFVEWLARTYGDDRLWQLVERQGTALTFVLDVNGRFNRVYGRTLSSLIDEFDAWLRREIPPRPRPAAQKTIRTIGNDARYARAPDGTEAVVADDVDLPTFLEIRGPDGATRVRENLTDLIIPRRQVMASPILVSGMSFTADGRWLYLTTLDLGRTYQTTRLLRVNVQSGDLDVVGTGWGPGGAISPDGATYYVADVDGDAWGLAAVDLTTKQRRRVIAPQPGRFVLRVAPSPSGDRLALSRWSGERFEIAVVDARTGAEQQVIAGTLGAPVYDATWIDDGRLLYLSTVAGRFQATVHDLATGTRAIASEAPYVAFEPRAANGTIRFLDRHDWSWELAEVAVPTATTLPTVAATASAPPDPDGVDVRSDKPYSMFDSLFTPQLHTLAVAAPSLQATIFGAGLAGGDRLGYQRWAISGFVQFDPKPARYSVLGGYTNAMLAPWLFSVEAGRFEWHQPFDDDDDATIDRYEDHLTVDVVGRFGRTFRGTTAIALEGIYTKDDFADVTPRIKRLGGGGLAFDHDNVETTSYGGIRRRLGLSLDGAYYPTDLSTVGTDLTDTRAELLAAAPLPWTRLHNLSLDLRHRQVFAREPVAGLAPLEVGGGPFAILYSRRRPDIDIPDAVEDPFFPERLRFTEPLRGFEELTFRADALSVAELTWTYPLIADTGFATSLYYFPSLFIRQVDLDLFGVAAVIDPPPGDGPHTRHYAAGGAVTLSLFIWRIPLLVQYQVAQRFSDDEVLAQQIGIAVGL